MKRSSYSVPWYNLLARRVLHIVFRLLFNILARVRVSGLEHIPTRGAYLIVFNHVSIYDPPVLVAYWPVTPEILGATEVWDRPGQDVIARLYGGIPVRRGEVDRQAMERMLAALRSGFPLMVAPEGTRSHVPGMAAAKPGIVYIIDQSKVPVIPVGITGTTDEFIRQVLRLERPRVEMRVGQPFYLPDLPGDGLAPKEIRQQKADLVMEKIAEILPPEYRGVYER